MSINSPLFNRKVFHKIQAISLVDISVIDTDNSLENDPYLQEDLCGSVEEFDTSNSNPKIPILSMAGTHKIKNSEEIDSALWKAAQQGKAELCQELLSSSFYGHYSADINYRGQDNWTPLHVAANFGHVRVCLLLLSCEEDLEVDARSVSNATPLQLACKNGYLEIAHALVKSGADIHLLDSDGNSCIHLAAAGGHELIVSWLLLQRPDLTVKNKLNKTPEECANFNCQKLFVHYKELQDILAVKSYKNKHGFNGRNSLGHMTVISKTRNFSICDNPFSSFRTDSQVE